MANELQSAFNEIAEERSLDPEVVLEAIQTALVSAYRKYANVGTSQAIEARFDPNSGRVAIFVEKEVTDRVVSPTTEVLLEKARYYAPECQIGDLVMVQEEGTTKKFGRIAAQNAKQVILQKIRESEREALYREFASREGEITTATVQSVNNRKVTLRLGDRAETVLLPAAQIPGERYRQHDKIRVYVQEVKRSNKGPEIIVSRSHRNMLRRLLEYEVPEIFSGQVEIKSIAREAGYRSKVAVVALQEGIDPVGACVGMRGIRIQGIVNELHEKIDVIEWSPNPETFIMKALSPARVTGVYLEDDVTSGRTALVIVPEDQLSLAIGKEGQNARLAAKLTGWRIDIKSVTETVQGGLDNLDVPPLDDLPRQYPQLVEEARRIQAKRNEGKVATQEELNILAKFADLVERRLLNMREEIRRQEQAHVEAVRATLPPKLFDMPVSSLRLPDLITEAIEPLGSVGQVMLALLIDEDRLKQLVSRAGRDAMHLLQTRLDEVMTVELDAMFSEDATTDVPADAASAPTAEAQVVASTEPETDDEQVERDAFGGIILPKVTASQSPAPTAPVASAPIVDESMLEDDEEDLRKVKGKPDKQKRRELIFDEDAGAVRAKRKRKDNRKRGDWSDFDY
ncbi:MAG: transcription termination factor NusA [Anaerolineae bacterium]|nr:transcription termination factor NusA [Anaerolineae bacterium]MDW8171492.1 transcription termination factor NusA [Anaerolineae bacterium]